MESKASNTLYRDKKTADKQLFTITYGIKTICKAESGTNCETFTTTTMGFSFWIRELKCLV